MDSLTPEQRSAQMSRIRSKDTKIELEVRHGLHRMGFRYRLGGAGLPGRPDIVLPRYQTAIFVHGCFWHGHTCHLFRVPKTRTEVWRTKIEANQTRDGRNVADLRKAGWKVEVVWECELRGRSIQERTQLLERLGQRILSNRIA
ncbi:very short patch repair endonuclease [Pseudoxanthomonas dokdonensis]|uniref:very short patch repair endonuclease n=1 Tax=Pseudoxanthomonas dokdonensis TaxID=344882 RepID=UPI0024806B24|nr:very short patch repair endonuclease [Pseudoxanthomonas dokdonensis]